MAFVWPLWAWCIDINMLAAAIIEVLAAALEGIVERLIKVQVLGQCEANLGQHFTFAGEGECLMGLIPKALVEGLDEVLAADVLATVAANEVGGGALAECFCQLSREVEVFICCPLRLAAAVFVPLVTLQAGACFAARHDCF